jgi:hypothetical protein
VLKALLENFGPEYETYEFIRVNPSDLSSIVVHTINEIRKPVILLEGRTIKDLSVLDNDKLDALVDFELRDGRRPVMGFHDGPGNMWISNHYVGIANNCRKQGWLTFAGS